MNGFVEVVPEISNYWTFHVKNDPNNQLNMGNRCGPVSDIIIGFGKFGVGKISFISTVNRVN